MDRYQVTGNEYVSLPTIREADGAVEGISFLMMGLKGMLELKGDDGLVKPFMTVDGAERKSVGLELKITRGGDTARERWTFFEDEDAWKLFQIEKGVYMAA